MDHASTAVHSDVSFAVPIKIKARGYQRLTIERRNTVADTPEWTPQPLLYGFSSFLHQTTRRERHAVGECRA